MTLLTRITSLFKADLHGILDSLEEPEIVLKQAIREMEEEIEQNERQLETLAQNCERLAALGADSADRLAELENQIDLCFEQSNETLARSLIRRKLEHAEGVKVLIARRDALEAKQAGLRIKLSEQREKLQAIVEKQRLFADTRSRERDTSTEHGWGYGVKRRISDEEIEVGFLQEKKRRSQGTRTNLRNEAQNDE
jgi:phage shock protein A